MKYIIMADGKGTRWNNYNGLPKHLICIDGVTLLQRTTDLIKEFEPNSEVIITTHNPEYKTNGATLYQPAHNELEIDRFTFELIEDNICFLYGDTYYSNESMKMITSENVDDIMFFGNSKSLVAIKVKNGDILKKHIKIVKNLYLQKKISRCIGWQVYESFCGLPFESKTIDKNFVYIKDNTRDFNTPKDLNDFVNI